MKVTQVNICPTAASTAAGRPALTPELLAACGARYSRNDEGLEAILSKVDPNNQDKSVDSIFKMMDYGHQSVADMVPVAMFIDQLSIFMAYYVWSLVPTAGGQESSTRYIKMSIDGLLTAEEAGIPAELQAEWTQKMGEAFQTYEHAYNQWLEYGEQQPELMRLPKEVVEDKSESGIKRFERMKRNFAFDRARYYIPVAAKTNMMLIMNARGWAQLCRHLLSHYLPEANALGKLIYDELGLVAPRLLKHAVANESTKLGILREFDKLVNIADHIYSINDDEQLVDPISDLDVYGEGLSWQDQLKGDLQFHENRYAWIGEDLRRIGVRFSWDAVSMAEIRDLNRHRTGNKYCPLVPLGFYGANDQIPQSDKIRSDCSSLSWKLRFGNDITERALLLLQQHDKSYIYWTVLGTQFEFEHLTTADKFIYEAELRTGVGAHYRYAAHLKDMLRMFYNKFPYLKGLIIEGGAEPE